MSRREKPLCAMAAFISSFRYSGSPANPLATKLQFWEIAIASGSLGCGRRRLSFCQSVNLVVVHEQGNIRVPANCMKVMVSTLSVTVPISCNRNYVQRVVGKFCSRSYRQGSSMEPIKRMAFNIVGQFSSLSYPRNHKHFPRLNAKFDKCLLDGRKNLEVSASRTPGWNLA